MTKKSVKRFDVGTFRKATKTDSGFLKVDGYATRVGIFTYRTGDGKIIKEFRSPEEVFKADSIATLKEVPVTNNHPPEFVTSENSKKYSVGFTDASVDREDAFVRVGLTVTDQDAIEDVEDGKVELSCGYLADVIMRDGVYNGEHYDAVQENIRYNHVAIIDKGRAGPEVKIRLDSADAEMVENKKADSSNVGNDNGKDAKKAKTMKRFKIDSVEFETEDSGLAQAVTSKIDTLTSEVKGKEDELQTSQGKLDALEAENKELKADAEKAKSEKLDHSDLMAMAKDRYQLEVLAKEVVGEEVKLDSMTDIEIKKAVIEKEKPEFKIAEKADTYVEGCFDIVKESLSKNDKAEDLKDSFGRNISDDKKYDSEAARQKMVDESFEAWKKPVGKHIQ